MNIGRIITEYQLANFTRKPQKHLFPLPCPLSIFQDLKS